jgi:protein-S-isoprenylcysteine O-methyltransferase Ste14
MVRCLFKSILHNIAVVLVGFGVAFIGTTLDRPLGIPGFHSFFATLAGWLFLSAGFLLRVWAAFYFYAHHLRVISLQPQKMLFTSGPYRFSRNPLYLGGNVFVFFGAALWMGSPMGLLITVLHLPLVDLFIRREEKLLERDFGENWIHYKNRVHTWI